MPTYLPLALIDVPADRMRPVTDEAVATLADSIEEVSLLQPIVVEVAGARYNLRAGEHRYKAVQLLHTLGTPIRHGAETIPKDEIPVVLFHELDPLQALLIEFDENIRRKEPTWQEQATMLARIAAVKEARGLPPQEVAREVFAATNNLTVEEARGRAAPRGISKTHEQIVVGKALANDPDVAKAKTLRDAVKIINRKAQKTADSQVSQVSGSTHFVGDFRTIVPAWESGSFDCILTDPPYGISIEQFSTQHSSEQEYTDTYESWLALMPDFFREAGRLLKPDAHGYAFCDLGRFEELAGFARAAGFETYSRPLIWNRTPDGRLPVPEKWPRRCYECILYFRRGNRDLYEIRSDVLSYVAYRDPSNYHGAKKPIELLVDLLQRSTRPGDRVADFFAGSGSTARACRIANRECWSVELDPAYAGLANHLLNKDKP